MLQAPSHLSRVCGHGHIKKFWLMQTQKENQACENKNSLLLSSSPYQPASKGRVKGLDSPPWVSSPSSHTQGYADASATHSKHSSFTCAETLSPSSQSWKNSSPLSPHSSGATVTKERLSGDLEGVESLSRTLDRDAHPATPSPRTQSLNVASEQQCQSSSVAVLEIDRMEPSALLGQHSNEELLSTSMEHSPDSHSSHVHSRRVQDGFNVQRPPNPISCNPPVKAEDCTSPSSNRGVKPSLSHARFSSPPYGLDSACDKGRLGLSSSRMQDMIDLDHNRSSQAALIQHPALKACTLCGTTKTPMWRSGPQGPKSLCNACGIRFKKYRSFPGQSESSELVSSSLLGPMASSKSFSRPLKRKQSTILSSGDSPRQQKVCVKPVIPDAVVQQQLKKSKWHHLVVKREHEEFNKGSSPWCAHAGPPSLKKIYGCSPFQSKFKKLAPMDEHLNVSRVFAKDEEEAAHLLMHLSCSLVY